MKFGSTVLSGIALIWALSSVSHAAAPKQPPVRQVKLTYDAGRDVTCLTRSSAMPLNRVQAKTSVVNVTVGGKKVPASGWSGKAGPRIGLDTDGDGLVNSGEFVNVARDGSVMLTAKSGGKDMTILCMDVRVKYEETKNGVTLMQWRMRGLHGWVGEIDSVKIRIIDDNFDGKYGTNGLDALLVGDSKVAVPFRHYHRIGELFYKFQIEPDGSSLKFQQIKSPHLAMVRSPIPEENLVGLVLENGLGAFDIHACRKTGIPSGKYHLAYGAIGSAESPLPFFRLQGTVQFDIVTDKTNMLRIGPPLQLVFYSEFRTEAVGKKTVRKIAIRHPDYAMGAAGEMYGPISFPNVSDKKGRPAVMVLQGRKPLHKAVLPEVNGKVGDYIWTLPAKLKLRGIRVVMAARTPRLGNVKGMRTLQQINSKTPFAPPETDNPSVTVTPWDKSDPTAKPGVKSKPRKPAVSAEIKAKRLVKLARNYQKMRLRAKAIEILRSAIKKYPKTEAAATARKMLKSMK